MFWRPSLTPGEEPHAVKILYGYVHDAARERRIPYKIYIAEAEKTRGPLPLVLWSHGLGGSRDGAAFLARYIAAHGYAVLHMTHAGSDTSIWEGKPGHPWDVIRAAHIPRKVSLDRFRDVGALLDRLGDIERAHPALAGRIDRERIGMSGHSFGALTTQIAAGQMLGRGRRRYSLREPRLKAGIAYSMSTAYNADQDPAATYGPIGIPMLYMTGTNDSSPLSGAGYEYRLPIFENARGPDQHLAVLDEADHMVFSGSRGKLAAYDKIRRHREIIQILSLCFWDAYLCGESNALEWLTGEGIEIYLGMDGNHVHRPNKGS